MKQRKLARNKHPFTLLEMMVALVILALISAFTGMQFKKLLDNHRFESQVTDLFLALQEAQLVASTYQTDLSLDIFSKDGILQYKFTTDEPLSSKKFNQNEVKLEHVRSIAFEQAKAAKLHFDIFSGGRIEPRGVLTFFQNSDKALWFDLQRGTLPIFASSKPNQVNQKVPVKPKEK